MIALYVVVLVIEFFLGICSSLYPLVYGCVLRVREGRWPSRERVWGCMGEWADEGDGGEGHAVRGGPGKIADYTLIGILVLGAWKVLMGERANVEEKIICNGNEKLRLLEDGQNVAGLGMIALGQSVM